jgi:DNA repair exonuclease SbcCD ATPase subunit
VAPIEAPPALAVPGLTEEQVRQIVDERSQAQVRAQLAAYREQLDARLEEMRTELASTKSPGDVRALQVQLAAQRKRIEALQRDIDRTAAYGGSDLFSVVLNAPEPKPGT